MLLHKYLSVRNVPEKYPFLIKYKIHTISRYVAQSEGTFSCVELFMGLS